MIKPKLGLFDLTMIVVSLVIGVGIFRTPSIVAEKAGSPFIFYFVWVLGGIISICGALTFAEIGSRLPAAGGFYKIFSHCYNPAYAFMLNWSLVITNAASAVGVAIVGAEYINPVIFPDSMQNDTGIKITAALVTLILFSLNYVGIKMGARTQNVLSMLKIVIMIGFCFAAFNGNNTATSISLFSDTGKEGGDLLKAIGVSLISVFFTFGGYQNTTNFGADINQPERNIPRAVFAGMGIVILLYLTINIAYVTSLGFEGVQQSKLVAAEMMKIYFGEKGFAITSVAIFISVLGFINTSMMHNPRIYYAMSEDRILPDIFRKVNQQTMTQEFALSFFTGLMILSLFLLGTFENILNYVMFIDSLSLVSAAGAIFILRRRAAKEPPTEQKIYVMKWFPVAPLLFMFVLLMVTVNVVWSDPRSALYGFIILMVGYPLYRFMKKILEP